MARDDKYQLIYPKFGVVIVTHPSDETLWAGGTLLMHPETKWTILSLCGGDNTELKEKFTKATELYGAEPVIGDFNSETEQASSVFHIQKLLSKLLFSERFDVIITHSFWGEYSHTQAASMTAKSVLGMTRTGQLKARQILQFAYEKKQDNSLITPVQEADILIELDKEFLERKLQIMTGIYGYSQDTIEVKSVSNEETFWLLGQKTYTTRKKEQKNEESA